MAAQKTNKKSLAEKLLEGERVIYELANAVFHEDAGGFSCTLNGVRVARFAIDGDDHVSCELLCTPALADLLRALGSHYSAGSQEGFLRFRRGKDPRPALEAKFGMAVGLANRDAKQLGARAAQGAKARVSALLGAAAAAGLPKRNVAAAKALPSLTSLGGPYVLLEREHASRWLPRTAARLLDGCGDGPTRVDAPFGPVLILGTPDRVVAFVSGTEALLVHVISFDADADDVLEKHVENIERRGFKKLSGRLLVKGPLVLFDSALSGKGATARNDRHLVVKLASGRYEVAYKTETPDDTTELFVVRLKA